METRHCGKQRPGVARPRPPGKPAHRWSRSGDRLADLLAGLHAVFAGICCAGTEKMVTYRPGGPLSRTAAMRDRARAREQRRWFERPAGAELAVRCGCPLPAPGVGRCRL